jgi:hypothetical protein
MVSTRTKIRCYAAIDEELSAPTTCHKSHIEKEMFFCAVARPRKVRLRRGESPEVSVLDTTDPNKNVLLYGTELNGMAHTPVRLVHCYGPIAENRQI